MIKKKNNYLICEKGHEILCKMCLITRYIFSNFHYAPDCSMKYMIFYFSSYKGCLESATKDIQKVYNIILKQKELKKKKLGIIIL